MRINVDYRCYTTLMGETESELLRQQGHEIASELPQARQSDALHRQVIQTIAVLLSTSEVIYEPDVTLGLVESMLGDEEPVYVTRAARYAYSAVLGMENIRQQMSSNQGVPGSAFGAARLTMPRMSQAENPFKRLSDDIVTGFSYAAQAYSEAAPSRDASLREAIRQLVDMDYTAKIARHPAYAEAIDTGYEAGSAIPAFLAFTQKLCDQGSIRELRVPQVITDTMDIAPTTRRDIAHNVAAIRIKRSYTSDLLTLNANPYWPVGFLTSLSIESYDYNQAIITARNHPTLTYELDLGGQEAPPLETPLPRMMCPIHALKVPGSSRSFLGLYVHAVINEAYDRGVFEPGTGDATLA